MAGRFTNPFPQFLDATPEVRSGAKLFFYAAGTSTKLNTYSDRNLSSANTNPVVLNSAGYPSVDIYLQDLDYKVVLAPSTDTDPPANAIWTADYVNARDSKLIAKTLTGSGSPNGTTAGTAGSSSILPDFYWDYTNSVLYVCTTTGTSSTAVWAAINASGSSTPAVPNPQGRLTLTSSTPIIPTDTTSATVYYTPYTGNLVPIYNGSSMIPTEFSEITLSLSASHALNTIYDIFVFSNSGVLTLATGPAWSVSTAGSGARGSGAGTTQITRTKGVWTNAVSITGRNGATTYTIGANLATYLGSIYIDSSAGQTTCHTSWGQSRKWGLWNAYNRVQIELQVGDSTASWNNTSASVRSSNGTAANFATSFVGLAEETVDVTFTQQMNLKPDPASATLQVMKNGVGVNSTSSFSGLTGTNGANAGAGTVALSTTSTPVARHVLTPQIGINNINALEQGNSAASVVVLFYGSNTNMSMNVVWRG